jgi:hypothetical protein
MAKMRVLLERLIVGGFISMLCSLMRLERWEEIVLLTLLLQLAAAQFTKPSVTGVSFSFPKAALFRILFAFLFS